ncbi:hypothetical protein M231_03951 [Tremella mesenterica]|uniref:Uncharacterized protein n=1 Tax=Tremella mesenterica TaxID=5217 RepID=A0A4Q1BLU0_TREME|nr:hypothetical protein M231_03951 [Tremella mesenterica]
MSSETVETVTVVAPLNLDGTLRLLRQELDQVHPDTRVANGHQMSEVEKARIARWWNSVANGLNNPSVLNEAAAFADYCLRRHKTEVECLGNDSQDADKVVYSAYMFGLQRLVQAMRTEVNEVRNARSRCLTTLEVWLRATRLGEIHIDEETDVALSAFKINTEILAGGTLDQISEQTPPLSSRHLDLLQAHLSDHMTSADPEVRNRLTSAKKMLKLYGCKVINCERAQSRPRGDSTSSTRTVTGYTLE